MDNNTKLLATAFHHVSYSVSDIANSKAFYAIFGFQCFKCWQADDDSIEIHHLCNDDKIVIELFCFAQNARHKIPPTSLETDLQQLGLKHIAFKVNDIQQYREFLSKEHHIKNASEIKQGRTNILYFFINDPDGNFVEIVQDDRLY